MSKVEERVTLPPFPLCRGGPDCRKAPTGPFAGSSSASASLWKDGLWDNYLNVVNHDGISNVLGLQENFDCLDTDKGNSDMDCFSWYGGWFPEIKLKGIKEKGHDWVISGKRTARHWWISRNQLISTLSQAHKTGIIVKSLILQEGFLNSQASAYEL